MGKYYSIYVCILGSELIYGMNFFFYLTLQ